MIIDQAVYAAMIEHMQQAAPLEGVGLLAGLRAILGSEPAEQICDRWVPQANVSEFPRARYQVDPAETLAAWEALDADGRRPWVVCHSHVTTDAAPSPNDIRYAVDPSLLHMIVSLAGPRPVVRLWRLDAHSLRPNPEARVRFQVVDLGFHSKGTTDLTHRVTGPTV